MATIQVKGIWSWVKAKLRVLIVFQLPMVL